MNLLDCEVTEILTEPVEKYNKWWIKVKYDCYGGVSDTELPFNTKQEALDLKVGYIFEG